MTKKIAPSSRIEALIKIRDKHSANDARTQCVRLLVAMQTCGGISTIEANLYLDILHPPARKLDLIKAGHIVVRAWVYELSSCSEIHRVGKYFYLGKTSYPLFDCIDDPVPA
jgi:hypothetical protein